MYTALVLDQASHQKVYNQFKELIPGDWEVIAHHMTCNMGDFNSGPLKNSEFKLGDVAKLTVISLAYDDKVMAVGVESEVPSSNDKKHITIAVNRKNGGKPFMSNQLKEWNPTSPIVLTGTIQEEN